MPNKMPKIDMEAIRRAEESLKALSSNFGDWIKDEVEKLIAAHAAFKATPDAQTLKSLFAAAHDLKGQGATYEYPLITDIASVMCKLLDDRTVEFAQTHAKLVAAHVQAMQAALAHEMKTQDDPAAKALLGELTEQVLDLQDAA